MSFWTKISIVLENGEEDENVKALNDIAFNITGDPKANIWVRFLCKGYAHPNDSFKEAYRYQILIPGLTDLQFQSLKEIGHEVERSFISRKNRKRYYKRLTVL